ncbi:MAG TPA: single-stranded DNA-binding protein [Proteiniclasticum sp.]|nr:single-stranded DNA-binding protein [Proteiniclasticum sp.]
MEVTNDNVVILEGYFLDEPEFSHELYGEEFYNAKFSVNRLSDSKDILNLTISGKLIEKEAVFTDQYTRISGQLRSYNKVIGSKNKLLLTVFVRMIDFPEEKAEEPNSITLTGFICKEPIYRMTPFGREITDLLLAVNRHFNKTDYIPVIAWGKNAKYSKSMSIGDNIKIEGRLQSRSYTKTYPDGVIEEKVAYEVSSSTVYLLEPLNDEPDDNEDMPDFEEKLNIS